MGAAKKQPIPLGDFVKARRRVECPVCQLPAEVLRQLAEARSHHIRRRDQMAWLTDEVGLDITSADLDRHYSGRHHTAA